MKAIIPWGQQSLELEIPEGNLLTGTRAAIAPNLGDPVQAMREALEHPLDYPALRLALTPDDSVAILVDEGIPHFAELLVSLLQHIAQAHVQPEAITLICPPPSTGQPWLDELPDEFQDVHIEVHQPADRTKLAYLSQSKSGLRIYVNRTAVDAGQLVVLTRRSYDPRLGYAGAETAIHPGISDAAAIEEQFAKLRRRAPGPMPWPIQQTAREVAWYVGAPLFVQVIEGAADGIAHIVAGPIESSGTGQQLLDDRWRIEFAHPADVVIASVTGDAGTQGIEELARALFAARRIVKPGGAIVLLSDIEPKLGTGFDTFRRHEEPSLAMKLLLKEKPPDLAACFQWASAASQARLYLLSGLPIDVVEELYATPMQHAGQAQRLLTEHASCALLPDAHRTLAVLRDDTHRQVKPGQDQQGR